VGGASGRRAGRRPRDVGPIATRCGWNRHRRRVHSGDHHPHQRSHFAADRLRAGTGRLALAPAPRARVAQVIRTPPAPARGGGRVGNRGCRVCGCRRGNHGRGGTRRQAGERLGTQRRFRLHVRRRRRRRRRWWRFLGIQPHADDADWDSDEHSSDSFGHTEHVHEQLNSGHDEYEDHDDDNRDDDANRLEHQFHRNCVAAYSDDSTAVIRSASTPLAADWPRPIGRRCGRRSASWRPRYPNRPSRLGWMSSCGRPPSAKGG
jgi:hypothetical protein